MSTDRLNQKVRAYWEAGVCGTDPQIAGEGTEPSREWFAAVEAHRYAVEPFIHSIAQFTRHRGKRMLEVGVGAGTDHLQWARAGLDCDGVDLTDAAIETTTAHLAQHGLSSNLQRIDAERLPFEDATFDLVYSWGVIHHSESPERIVAEIQRVLKPAGQFIGMMYNRHSLVALQVWAKHGLLAGRPFRSLADAIWHHVESIGTKAYTPNELRTMFRSFAQVRTQTIMTTYDTARLPGAIVACLPAGLGWFIAIHATK